MMMKDFSRRKRVHFKSQPDDVAPPPHPWEGIDRVNDLEATDVLSKLRLEGPIDVRTDIETEWTMNDETNSCPTPDWPSASQKNPRSMQGQQKWPQLRTPLAVQPVKRSDQKCVQQWKRMPKLVFFSKLTNGTFSMLQARSDFCKIRFYFLNTPLFFPRNKQSLKIWRHKMY